MITSKTWSQRKWVTFYHKSLFIISHFETGPLRKWVTWKLVRKWVNPKIGRFEIGHFWKKVNSKMCQFENESLNMCHFKIWSLLKADHNVKESLLIISHFENESLQKWVTWKLVHLVIYSSNMRKWVTAKIGRFEIGHFWK